MAPEQWFLQCLVTVYKQDLPLLHSAEHKHQLHVREDSASFCRTQRTQDA